MRSHVEQRIYSSLLGATSPGLRKEILPNTTPVPFFGDIYKSSVITVGINPSSNEFPDAESERRLVHLTDVQLSPNHYREGQMNMSYDQAKAIEVGLLQYFQKNPYLRWFGAAEIALGRGLSVSYFETKENAIACHLDLFPWATARFSDIAPSIRVEFMRENSYFLRQFFLESVATDLVILGDSCRKELLKHLDVRYEIEVEEKNSDTGSFHMGKLSLENRSWTCWFLSQGPSARGTQSRREGIHEKFGDFIASRRQPS